MTKTLLTFIFALALAFPFVGNAAPDMEEIKAGVSSAADEAGNAAEEAGEATADAAEEAGEAVEEAADRLQGYAPSAGPEDTEQPSEGDGEEESPWYKFW